MTTPIYQQLADIHAWTDRNIYTHNDYERHPFAATNTTPCGGTCGGVIVDTGDTLCIPCLNKRNPLRASRPAPPPQRDTCLRCGTPLDPAKKQRRYCSRICAMTQIRADQKKATT